jgi:hypothetical protein
VLGSEVTVTRRKDISRKESGSGNSNGTISFLSSAAMDDDFTFQCPAADIYQPIHEPAPPSNPSKSILSLPTEVIVDIAGLNYKTALALMCTNRVLHAAGITALYAKVFLKGSIFTLLDPHVPNRRIPGVLGGLLAKREHTAALRFLKIISMPKDEDCWTAFTTLVYRVFERAHGLVCIDLNAMWVSWRPPSAGNNLLQPIHPQNLHTLHLPHAIVYFSPHLLSAPSLKEVRFGGPDCRWGTLLEHDQGPYPQVISLRYVHEETVFETMNGHFLKMFEVFPSVESLEVKIWRSPKVSGKVPQPS